MIELLSLFSEYDLSYSSLFLSIDLILTSKTKNKNFLYFILISSLFKLKNYQMIQKIVENNKNLLKYNKIRHFYINSLNHTEKNNLLIDRIIENIKENHFNKENTECHFSLSPPEAKNSFYEHDFIKSVDLFYVALTKSEKIRKKYFLQSFYLNTNNTEPLIYLYKESLVTFKEILDLIEKIENKDLLKTIKNMFFNENLEKISLLTENEFFFNNNLVFFPINLYISVIYNNIKENNNKIFQTEDFANNIFRFCILLNEYYSENYLVFFILGLFYIYKKNYKEANKCFKKSVKYNKSFGYGYLYLGITFSFLRESESSIKNLTQSYLIMDNFSLPSYYLAYEYQQMNNVNKSLYFYRLAINKLLKFNEKTNFSKKFLFSSVLNSYVYFLIYNEKYELEKEIIEEYKIENLLKVYNLLFTGSFGEAQKSLELITEENKNEMYFATKAYIKHLVDDYDTAIEYYRKSISISRNVVVEELCDMAMKNKIGHSKNVAFDFSNCLFECLQYKNKIMGVFE